MITTCVMSTNLILVNSDLSDKNSITDVGFVFVC
jgi:hypothetical protein